MLSLHVAVLLVGSAGLPLLATFLMRLRAWRSARAQAAAQLQRLRELHGKDGVETVTGTLRVEGAELEEHDRIFFGALTRWSSARRFSLHQPASAGRERAERLVVVAGERRVELHGPVEVLAGSRTVFEGRRSDESQRRSFIVRASLSDGDEVTVAGVAGRATEGHGHRDRGDTILEPLVDSGVIFACAAATKTLVSGRALLRNLVVVPLMLLACLPPLGLLNDYTSTECREECKHNGRCAITSSFVAGSWRDGLAGVWRGHHVECGAPDDASCRASVACRRDGRCTAVGARCVATRGEDCRNTASCLERGLCSPSDGECRAVTEEDCLSTDECVDRGRCAPRDGACLEVTDASCAATRDCKRSGTCSARDGKCVAATREDCAQTFGCRENGRCAPDNGQCHAVGDEDCRASSACLEKGQCSFERGLCTAKWASDCVGSRGCAVGKECALRDSVCVEDAANCRGSAACSHWGRCEGDDLCRADEKADCAKAEVCRGKPNCRALEGSCAATCREAETCRRSGECTDRGEDSCIAGSDADCVVSQICLSLGFCTAEDGLCAVKSNADCAQTTACKERGVCTLEDKFCVVGAADCAATLECKRLGQCTPSQSFLSRCEATSAACENAEVCTKFGWCTPVKVLGSLVPRCGPVALR